jgi:hypothetical protein
MGMCLSGASSRRKECKGKRGKRGSGRVPPRKSV